MSQLFFLHWTGLTQKYFQAFSTSCRNSTSAGAVLVNCLFQSSYWLPFEDDVPTDILATIRFSGPSGVFRLYLGLTSSTGDILSGAKPISITPGSNIHAWSSISVQERLLNQKAAAFGILQVSDGVLFYEISG